MDDALVVLGNSVVLPPQLSFNQSFLLGKFSALGNPPQKGIICYKFFVIKQNSKKIKILKKKNCHILTIFSVLSY
jgi:hypothetical protein